MNVQTYKLKGSEFTVKAFVFNAEHWIHQRHVAYPMVDYREANGFSSLGELFTYQPVLYNYPVHDGDYIIIHRNCYGLVKSELFNQMYSLVNE